MGPTCESYLVQISKTTTKHNILTLFTIIHNFMLIKDTCFEVFPDCGNESQETIELGLRVPIFYSTCTILRPAINGDFYRFS